MIIVVEPSSAAADLVTRAIGRPAHVVDGIPELRAALLARPDVDVVVLGARVDELDALDLAEDVRVSRPELGVVLLRTRVAAPVLTAALRAGIREVVRERDTENVGGAVARVVELARVMRERSASPVPAGEPAPQRGQVVTVFSAKGGCGKTMLATNMAAALSARAEVCVVDLDLAFGDVAIAMQLNPVRSLADAVQHGDNLDESALRSLLVKHGSGVHALLAPVDPAAGDHVTAAVVTRVLTLLRGMFDVVIVDTPAVFSDPVLAALDESDRIVLIATLEVPALKNLKLSLQTLDLLGVPRSRLEVVVNRSDSKVGLSLSEVEKTLGTPVTCEIPSDAAVPAAINRGLAIVLDSPGHPVSRAVTTLALRQLGGAAPAGAVPQQRDQRRSILRLLERRS